jgi:hypothetical protein
MTSECRHTETMARKAENERREWLRNNQPRQL